MIKLPPVVDYKELILKRLPAHPKTCAICFKSPQCNDSVTCAACSYPYEHQHFFSEFDYFDYLQYQAVNSEKAHAFFIDNAVLNPCSFCGADAVLNSKTQALFDRYYPAERNNQPKYKDSLSPEIFYLTCTGCTFSTPYLYLYQFYALYESLIDAWNNGQSRLPLIKYVDLKLPDWSINFQLLKTLKKYAATYQEKFTPQHSLFDDISQVKRARKPDLDAMRETYILYG